LREAENLELVADMQSEAGPNNLYKFKHDGKEIAIFHPGVGAPLAAGNLEIAIASGCRNFIAIGSAGLLEGTIEVGNFLIPTSAVRDEGTSYHYMVPSREAHANPQALNELTNVLDQRSTPYQKCKT
jgi:uridine phosphorylase